MIMKPVNIWFMSAFGNTNPRPALKTIQPARIEWRWQTCLMLWEISNELSEIKLDLSRIWQLLQSKASFYTSFASRAVCFYIEVPFISNYQRELLRKHLSLKSYTSHKEQSFLSSVGNLLIMNKNRKASLLWLNTFP